MPVSFFFTLFCFFTFPFFSPLFLSILYLHVSVFGWIQRTIHTKVRATGSQIRTDGCWNTDMKTLHHSTVFPVDFIHLNAHNVCLMPLQRGRLRSAPYLLNASSPALHRGALSRNSRMQGRDKLEIHITTYPDTQHIVIFKCTELNLLASFAFFIQESRLTKSLYCVYVCMYFTPSVPTF
jgi:hypothetical protein